MERERIRGRSLASVSLELPTKIEGGCRMAAIQALILAISSFLELWEFGMERSYSTLPMVWLF